MITPSSKEGTVCRGWELYNRAYLPSQGTHSDDGPSVHHTPLAGVVLTWILQAQAAGRFAYAFGPRL